MSTLVNSTQNLKPEVTAFFDKDTATFSYVVKDPSSAACAVVDSVMDINYPSGTLSYQGADAIINFIRQHKLRVEWHIETHVHADHLSAAPYIKEKLGGRIGISDKITVVQETFAKVFNVGSEFKRDGSQFDHLFHDGEKYKVGNLDAVALHTPGHTPACMTHVMGDAAFVGDTLFMPDQGTARADFPGGSAHTLFQSIQRIYQLPDETRLFMCHDYPEQRAVAYETTVAAEKQGNIHANLKVNEADYIKRREARDATLEMPRLILPSLQVNMRAGHLPPAENNGMTYLKIPVNAFKK